MLNKFSHFFSMVGADGRIPIPQGARLVRAVAGVAQKRTEMGIVMGMAALSLRETESAAPTASAWRSGKPSAFREWAPAKSRDSKNVEQDRIAREKEA
jgi:hypothetical protein